jgi:O-antigen ligase
VRRFLAILIAVVVGLAPLTLGSNRPLPWAYNAVAAGVIALLCAVLAWQDRDGKRPLRLDVLAISLILWSSALLWAAFQLLPLKGSGLASPVWQLAGTALGSDMTARITVNSAATAESMMRFLTYVCIFLSTFVVSRDEKQGAFLMRAVVSAAMIYAVYGLLRTATGSDKLLWFDQSAYPGLTASFVNPNSAATYFGMATCLSLLLLLRRTRHLVNSADLERSARAGLERFIHGMGGRLGLELAGFVLLLTATLLTRSRAGVFATLIALAVGLVLQGLRDYRVNGRLAAMLVILVSAAAGFAAFQASGMGVAERILETQLAKESRIAVFADTLVAISDHALMGTGLGTFEDIFPLYRTETPLSYDVLDKAHNDYLEILLGLGVPAGMAIIVGILSLVFRCFRGVFKRQRNSYMPMAAVLVGILVGFHAFFDFSLQIQAIAMTFAVILGVGVAQSVSDRSARSRAPSG